LAVTVVAAVSVRVQEPVPEQPPPLQPVKMEPEAAVTVKVVLLENFAKHLLPQLIPWGELVTVPVPVPVLLTVSVKL
jgi:hypothetical protein